ncbi:SGNH/GDSL hydrolase family protein [[Mycoplasma] anseris]|uniref:SGNH/GDSL hydrolase family protein n=1 Tax=[Mycoplasma] anseris TaxID=92400 RepID=A0A2Z4ND29_9BACT|nr:SGNH/GDSL hydrolase family protein [[Mycoplasma] anseris]AWX69472.1 SGNH/GDSL hydrolase family protein [[Mycoplasma] anseris]
MWGKKLKFVALGDSITQGFNSKIGGTTAGFKKENEVFSKGFSYADYLMEYFFYYLKHNNREYKEIWNEFSYSNFGLAVARINDYLNILDEDINDEVVELFQLNKNIEKQLANQNSSFLKLESDDIKLDIEKHIKQIKTEISQANLITISLGGNEYQSSFPLVLLKSLILEENFFIKQKIKEKIINQLKEIVVSIKEQYLLFIKKIKQLNPEATIVIVSYVPPFLPFLLSYEKILKRKHPLIFNDFWKSVLNVINSAFAEVSIQTGTLFVNCFEFKNWNRDSRKLVENFLDVHPTELGYQQIARKIFLKLLKTNSLDLNLNVVEKNNYLSSSLNIAKNISNDCKNHFQQHLEMLYNQNRINVIFRSWNKQSNQIQNPYFVLLQRETKNFIEEESNLTITTREQYTSLNDILIKNIFSIFNNLDEKTEFRKAILKLKEYKLVNKVFKDVINSPIIEEIIQNIEKLYKKTGCINLHFFIKKALMKNETLIIELLRTLINKENSIYKKSISMIVEATMNDLRNQIRITTKSSFFNTLLNNLTLNDKYNADLLLLLEQIKTFLLNLPNRNKIDQIYYSFLEKNKEIIKVLFIDVVSLLKDLYNNNKGEISQIILKGFNIPQKILRDKDWKKIETTLDKFFLNFEKTSTQKVVFKTFFKALKAIKLWDWVELKEFKFSKFLYLILKKFGKLMFLNIFNKNTRLINKLLFILVNLKIKNKLK